MQMRGRSLASVLAAALALGAVAYAAADDKTITLTGCVVKGDGDGAGYLMTNSPVEPSFRDATDHTALPGAVGTSGSVANIFYWLDGDRDLKKNVGHQVQIQGHVKGDVKDGEMKVDRKDNWTEMTVKSDGRTMKARVPNASIVPGKDEDHKMNVLVRKIDVDHVKMLSASCQ